MRIAVLTVLTMIAFAANSVLTRMALAGGHIDAIGFGVIRLLAGAAMLALLVLVLRGRLRFGGRGRVLGVVSLLVYLYGFSTAYTGLDAGLGALILFGVVQITMFGGGLAAREAMPPRRWVGAGLAFGGLVWLLWPGGGSAPVSLPHALLMALAGVGWGLYSLAGRQGRDALMGTTANFVLAAPAGLLIGLALPAAAGAPGLSGWGIALAVLCGAVTSGLGYALWYTVLPHLAASAAAVAQLTVPVIAMAGGALLLGEALTARFVIAGLLVLGGVAISVSARRR